LAASTFWSASGPPSIFHHTSPSPCFRKSAGVPSTSTSVAAATSEWIPLATAGSTMHVFSASTSSFACCAMNTIPSSSRFSWFMKRSRLSSQNRPCSRAHSAAAAALHANACRGSATFRLHSELMG
jgi:hypothetical protein